MYQEAFTLAFLGSIGVIMSKYVTGQLDGATLSIIVTILSGIFSFVYLVWNRSQIIPVIKALPPSIFVLILGIGVIGLVTSLMYYRLMSTYDAYIVSSMVSLTPLFVFILSVLFLGSEMSVTHLVGIIGLIGSLFLITS